MTERIRLRGVSKEFTVNGTKSKALDDINLTVNAGEIYGLIGRSGAGKSTLLRTINGLELPSSGEVFVDGVNIGALNANELRELRRRIGMVFQQFGLWNSRTVYGNIATPLKLAGWKPQAIRNRVAELLDFVGLGGKAFARPRQLSGGQKQRVGIARAIANNPSILLADEATSALDPQTTTEIVDLLRSVNEQLGITIVVVTHEMDVIGRLADRVSILSDGRVIETGDIHQILARPHHPVSGALVGPYTRTSLTEAERSSLRDQFRGRRISVAVEQHLDDDPVISRLARQHHVDFTIIQGAVARVKDQPYGQLNLALHGDAADLDRFVTELADRVAVTEW